MAELTTIALAIGTGIGGAVGSVLAMWPIIKKARELTGGGSAPQALTASSPALPAYPQTAVELRLDQVEHRLDLVEDRERATFGLLNDINGRLSKETRR